MSLFGTVSIAKDGVPGIYGFEGQYSFLSNFHTLSKPIRVGGLEFATSEHLYQSFKTNDIAYRSFISEAPTPGKAKRLGAKYRDRIEWKRVKIPIMYQVLRVKYTLHEERALLLATQDLYIEETNQHHDSFWGVFAGEGLNILGHLTMCVRTEIQNDPISYTKSSGLPWTFFDKF